MQSGASSSASDSPLDESSPHPDGSAASLDDDVSAAAPSAEPAPAADVSPSPDVAPAPGAQDSALAQTSGDPEPAPELDAGVQSSDAPVDAAVPDAVASTPPAAVPADPARVRPLWRRIVEGLAPVLVAVVVAVVFMSLKTDRGYRYHASSTYPGYKQDGWTGRIGSADIFFSTNNEMNPWVSIDLGETRTVHRVKVTNRTDFPERAIPLVVEVEEPDGTFREVARRDKKFAKWTFEFPPESTRRVRLRVDGRSTFLHLARVLID